MSNKFIYNNHLEAKKVLSTLELELANCEEFIFSVAFISESGLTALLQILKELEDKNIQGKILTTNYLYFNTPKVLEKIENFKNIQLRIYDTKKHNHGFHTKGYLFKREGTWRSLLGSANLTISALTINKEWNTFSEDKEFSDEVIEEFNKLWKISTLYKNMRDDYICSYKENNENNISREIVKNNIGDLAEDNIYIPNKMQRKFIENFKKLRSFDNKALLISATGTGKTFAAGFAMKSIKAKKVLFIVHREQIARQAQETFKKIFCNARTYGLLTGNEKNIEVDFIFTTIQTISKDKVLQRFSKDNFDEIIIDEVHRAGASSYLKVMNYFEPTFYLGMTASPDRTDGFSIYELFNNNIVYEVRLNEAMEENLLCPFHYFGVSDLVVDGVSVDELSEFNNLTREERVNHIIDKIMYYGYSGNRVKGLVFCSNKKEAAKLSEEFNNRGFKTISLSGADGQEVRSSAINKLVSDKGDTLDYIFTVDIFNEGVDIPEINQVVMLRPTQSAIIFIQQLGRGLRKNKDKDFVVVIDFIANYKNNFLIPIALSGDNSYDKDNIRRFLSQGVRYLPGRSTIHFDNIAKEKIYKALDNVKLNTWLFIAEEYTKLKNKLGRVPTYYDFENYDTLDIRKIFEVAGSYHEFLEKKDKDYKIKLSKVARQMLHFVSTNLILSKKIEELIILKIIITGEEDFKKQNIEAEFKNIMITNYNKFIADYELDVSKKILTNNFVTSSVTKKKFNDCIFLDENSKTLKISKEFKEELHSREFRNLLNELVNYGIYRYNKYYKENLYKDTNFVLYEKYSFEDICKLFSWSINYVPLAIGGYKYDEQTKTLPVFINYDIDENSFNHDYVHGFLPNDGFTSMSKPRRNYESKECEYFYNNETKIYLFMRKNKDDKDGARIFYFLGEMKIVDKPKLVERAKSGDTVLQFYYKILTPLREDMYEYFTREKV